MRKLAIILALSVGAFGQSLSLGGTVTLSGTIALTEGTPTVSGCGSGYSFGPITVTPVRASTSDQTNYPLKVTGRDPRLATSSNGGEIQNTAANSIGRTGPADLVFCTASSGGTALKYEAVYYNGTNGDFEFWVQIPTLHSGSTDTFYLFANKSSVTTSQQDLSMWGDVNYAGVWHLPDGSTLDTINSVDGASATISSVSPIFGMADGGAWFQGNAHKYLKITDKADFRPASNLTIEAWVNTTGYSSDRPVFQKPYRNTASWSSPYDAYAMHIVDGKVGMYATTSGSLAGALPSSPIVQSSWTPAMGTYDGSNLKSYVSGALAATTSKTGNIDYTGGPSDVAVGVETTYLDIGGEWYAGRMDELRIATDTKTADWAATTAVAATPYVSTFKFAETSFSVPTVLQYTSCQSVGVASCVLPFDVTATGVMVASVSSIDVDCTGNSITDSLSLTYTLQVVSHYIGTLHNYYACIYTAPITATGPDTITTFSSDISVLVQEVKKVTVTSIATNSAGNHTQPLTMTATSPNSNSFMVCTTVGDLTNQTAGNGYTPSSAKLFIGPTAPSDHGAAVQVIYKNVGSGSQSCSFDTAMSGYSTPGAAAVMAVLGGS